ncbi:hypothetical protein [Streptomyces albidoflavus]|uniref:hypothetical protein n=1 Tax=Streptomyces albidoflavus TaxID=1886 RepID=UPI00332EFF62
MLNSPALGSATPAHGHIAGSDAISRYDLGVLIAQRDGLNALRLRVGQRADTRSPGALDVRIDSHTTSVG